MDFYAELVAPPIFKAEQDNLVTVQPVKEQVTVKSTLIEQIVTPSTSDRVIDEITVEPIILQEKTVTPTKEIQIIEYDGETHDGLSIVEVEPIPDNYIDTSDATASANQIVQNETAYVNGEKIIGTLSLIKEKDINFYAPNNADRSNWDLIAGYTMEEAHALTELPVAPVLDGLIFTGWNYTLEQVNTLDGKRIIGATYKTASGKTEIDRIFTTVTGFVSYICIYKEEYGLMTINWIDGTSDTTINTGYVTFTHTYAGEVAGTETIDFQGGYYLQNTVFQCNIFKSVNSAFDYNVVGIRLSEYVTSIRGYAFYNCSCLKFIIIPNNITHFVGGQYVFYQNRSLRYFISPINFTYFVGCFENASVYWISLPELVTGFSTTIRNNPVIKSVVVPTNTTNLTTNTFNGCTALEEIIMNKNLTTLSGGLLSNLNSIEKIKFNSNIQSIGANTFNANVKLTVVSFLENTQVPPLASIWLNLNPLLKILVPAHLYEQWIVATNWTAIADYIVSVEV